MRPLEIRNHKIEMRAKLKKERAELNPSQKAEMDNKIAANVRRLHQYKRCDTLLVYVSTPIEIDTREIIENAWADGKKVAVPRCITESREMTFHYISSFSELSKGTFGVLEPAKESPKVTDFSTSLMIVPGFMFDLRGYRLGYGMGYYDRAMSGFMGPSAGVCYSKYVKYHIPNGRYDQAVDIIVTEEWIRSKKVTKKKSWQENR